jgi:hypothetical protein
LFLPYGNILQTKVIYSKETNESLTYGFVMYENDSDALKAVHALNGFLISGKQLKVSFARPRDEEIKGCKLHVSKLPTFYSQEMVHELFAQVSPSLSVLLHLTLCPCLSLSLSLCLSLSLSLSLSLCLPLSPSLFVSLSLS